MHCLEARGKLGGSRRVAPCDLAARAGRCGQLLAAVLVIDVRDASTEAAAAAWLAVDAVEGVSGTAGLADVHGDAPRAGGQVHREGSATVRAQLLREHHTRGQSLTRRPNHLSSDDLAAEPATSRRSRRTTLTARRWASAEPAATRITHRRSSTVSNLALITLPDALRQCRRRVGTRWRRLTVGRQALAEMRPPALPDRRAGRSSRGWCSQTLDSAVAAKLVRATGRHLSRRSRPRSAPRFPRVPPCRWPGPLRRVAAPTGWPRLCTPCRPGAGCRPSSWAQRDRPGGLTRAARRAGGRPGASRVPPGPGC